MLKEQLLAFAMKAISKAHESKELIKQKLNTDLVQDYVEGLKDALIWMVDKRLTKDSSVHSKATKTKERKKQEPKKAALSKKTVKEAKVEAQTSPKSRKSSIKPVKEIKSIRAERILELIKKDAARMVKKADTLEGKKSLAHLVWALGHAERAKMAEGISVHDVSSLLYKAAKIELYPINISRVVHSHANLVRQVSQEKRSKTYLLTENGERVFKEKFL
jgi:hypothetical protein